MAARGRSSRRALAFAAGIVALVAAIAAIAIVVGLGREDATVAEETPSPTVSATPTRAPTPEPTPTPTGFPENTASYDPASLQVVEVFEVNGALPVDDDPYGETAGVSAQPIEAGAPVFADPEGEPVAYLPRAQHFEGTIVPVVEQQEHWVRVLLVGRQSVPSAGDSGQVTGWLRTSDVELTENPYRVEVSLSERTIDVATDEGTERVAEDFAFGAAATPTPLGRSFIMMTRTASLAYTRGHPLVYLSVQSPTLDGFDGQSVAVTAFHYHDVRSGAISNGCIRLDEAAISRLAELPAGTPVYIRD
ncbi:L,D-transpeptidase [Microbacterium betulae]|uniref:L,D-transpeptidase n=1 Tax=Microbacterium betulae TaxID=2981139 RepID=A0AA97I684_9MICO|nr:L,D-transpeptidase [Microbacterium sp. AB]WOF24541.1 L,D-transpeptidase [Microbacterium sp. AB]